MEEVWESYNTGQYCTVPSSAMDLYSGWAVELRGSTQHYCDEQVGHAWCGWVEEFLIERIIAASHCFSAMAKP